MDKSKQWQINKKYSIFKGRILELFEMECFLPSKNMHHNFYSLHYYNWANVFALTEDNKVILVKQHRMGKNMVTTEVPAGAIDEGENPEDAAIRELLEETGYQAGNIHLLKKIAVNPALQDNTNYSFIATNCKKVQEVNFDDPEEIDMVLRDKDLVFKQLEESVFDNSLSFLTILLAKNYLDKNKK